MDNWEKDELKSARRHDEKHNPVALYAERDRAEDESRAMAKEQGQTNYRNRMRDNR